MCWPPASAGEGEQQPACHCCCCCCCCYAPTSPRADSHPPSRRPIQPIRLHPLQVCRSALHLRLYFVLPGERARGGARERIRGAPEGGSAECGRRAGNRWRPGTTGEEAANASVHEVLMWRCRKTARGEYKCFWKSLICLLSLTAYFSRISCLGFVLFFSRKAAEAAVRSLRVSATSRPRSAVPCQPSTPGSTTTRTISSPDGSRLRKPDQTDSVLGQRDEGFGPSRSCTLAISRGTILRGNSTFELAQYVISRQSSPTI